MRILAPAEATALQAALNVHGASLTVDGHFGELSHLALIQFQHKNALPETGNPDPATLAALGIPNLFLPPPNPRKELPMETVLANVKSAWLSKLNWTLAAGAIFNLFAFFGLTVPADVKDAIVLVGNGVVIIAAWVIKTWFTTAISTPSAKKL